MTTGMNVFHKLATGAGRALDGLINMGIKTLASILHLNLTAERQEGVARFIRFCLVGMSNVAVSYTVNVCTLFLLGVLFPGFAYDYVLANITAFLVAVYWSFYWNSRKVFHFKTSDRALRRKALLKCYLCYALTGIVLNNVLSTIWIRGLGISKYFSPLMNLPFTIPINYLTNKKWAFSIKK